MSTQPEKPDLEKEESHAGWECSGTERGRGNVKQNQAVLSAPVLERFSEKEHPTAQSCTLEGPPELADLRGAQRGQSWDAAGR